MTNTNTTENSAVNDIDGVKAQFIRSLGNGVKAGEYLQQLILSVVKSRDTTILVKAITGALEKNDDQAARTIRMVAGQVWPKARVTTKPGKPVSIKISGITEDQEALNRLADATERGLSIRHQTYRNTIAPKEDKLFEAKSVDQCQKFAERFADNHEKQEVGEYILHLTRMLDAFNSLGKAAK